MSGSDQIGTRGTRTFSKDPPTGDNSTQAPRGRSDENLVEPAHAHSPSDSALESPRLDLIYADRARFVWLSLQRMGVRKADLDDVCHDVFLVIQKRLPDFERGARLSPWIFGICARVVANYRRRAYLRLEVSSDGMNEDDAATSPTPEGKAAQRQALATAERILESMDPIKRVVFVMFELEGMACPEIAAELELPIGTVYSRLHAARKIFSEKAQHALNSKASRGRP